MFEEPRANAGISIEENTLDLVVFENDLFVDPPMRIEQSQFFRVVTSQEISGGKQFNAGDLELGTGDRTLVTHSPVFRQMIGRDFCLFEERCYQPVGQTTMLYALAYGLDARVVGLQGVVYQDPLLAS